MAPSAAPSIQQSYSAGTCRLDLTLQPSALSHWYPKPIVEQVAFELWMADHRDAEPVLLAKGDRTTLQAIADHIEHRTQTTLSITQTTRQPKSKLPENIHLPEPLSYLQLCDISSVLSQYEQAATALPISLSPAAAATRPIAVAEESPLIKAARSRPVSLAQPPTPKPLPRKKGKLLPFPTGRRATWASSAAAALFAVGLATIVWDRSPAPTSSSVADSEIAEPEIVGSNPDRLRLNRSETGERTAALPPNSPSSTPKLSRPHADRSPTIQSAPRPVTPNPSARTNNPSINRSTSAGNVTPRVDQPTAPSSTAASQESSADRATTPENAGPSNRPNTDIALQPDPQTNNPNESSEDNIVAAAPVPSDRSDSGSLRDRKIASADSEAESSEAESIEQAAVEVPVAEADLPELEPSRPQAAARASRDDFSEEISGATPPLSRASLEEIAPSPEAIAQQESETIAQVTNYFLNQWSPTRNISAPLSYQLRLSSFGEIISFSALTEASEAYRDRLLPDSTILFPPSNSTALPEGLILKVTVSPDGQVSTEKASATLN